MGTVIIFALVAILGVFGLIGSLRDKNILGLMFSFGAIVVFGWFSVMTFIHHGLPVAH
ncbi:DUF2759 domain-containing protein [Bacillus sp. PS06]|uniref:DUF2759 domain-containing protein n=1 Tax=Bacillus sp. PS06 TaxID=2764176 RepID=UPI00177EB539|nr:DUF2759 domain-containing protein [Bacillus sp. PS06]MBD8071346.1 DUF2759 domain-containing protein [Bacillus sp. PS06]